MIVAVGDGGRELIGSGVVDGGAVSVGTNPQADKANPRDVVPLNLRKSRRDSDVDFVIATFLSFDNYSNYGEAAQRLALAADKGRA